VHPQAEQEAGLEVERKKCQYGLEDGGAEGAEGGRVWGGGIAESGAEPRPKTILVRSEGARTALVAMYATEMT